MLRLRLSSLVDRVICPVKINRDHGSFSSWRSTSRSSTNKRLLQQGRSAVAMAQDLKTTKIREGFSLLPKQETADFLSMFPQLIKDATERPEHSDMPETNAWLARVLDYNAPFGKRTRGMTTALAYRYFTPEPTQENIKLSYVLGWCAEILQAYLIVMDDILDGSETRRGSPCWYRVDGVGVTKACNDALLLESTAYLLLKMYFRGKSYYTDLVDVFRDVNHKTCYGQSLDSRTAAGKKFETFTMDRFLQLAKYKTSFYTFYFPVRLAMTMAGIVGDNQGQGQGRGQSGGRGQHLLQQLHAVSISMGEFYQVQNDYTDCFSDSGMMGKIGTDIQDGNCTWLFVQASQIGTLEQKKTLWENYGRSEPERVERVKELYVDLGLPGLYAMYEEETYAGIMTEIRGMSDEMPKQLFFDMLEYIYQIKV